MYSFSQNFEDVYIRRAFAEILDGFYIDAGAFDPLVDSVTKMLYDLGWSGINLEPGPSFPSFACRTRDINLPLALAGREGQIDFYYNPADPGTSTTCEINKPSESLAVQNYKVDAVTLASVVQAHALNRHIHFLKLDIEGSEWDVLQSTNWHEIRPELIIAESSKPYTNIRRDEGWAAHMETYGYSEVFFDGINTYYLRQESLHRGSAFKYPINVLDGVRKFDPQQHHVLYDQERVALIGNITQEVARVVEAGSSSVRDYIENDLGQTLQAQKDLVAKLTSEQSEYFSQLRAIADGLPYEPELPKRHGGGNSTEAVIQEIADGVAKLVEDRERLAATLARMQATFDEQEEALRSQTKRADQAVGEARLLAKRLTVARASRLAMIEVAERIMAARTEAPAATESASNAPVHPKELDREMAMIVEPSPLAERIAKARTVSMWRWLFRLGNRALVRRANSYRDNGQWLEAALAYARAFAISPKRADLCLQLAIMLTQMRAFPLAERAYREALTIAPEDALIYLHLGYMFELSHHPDRARLAYLESERLNPGHPHVAEGLSRVGR